MECAGRNGKAGLEQGVSQRIPGPRGNSGGPQDARRPCWHLHHLQFLLQLLISGSFGAVLLHRLAGWTVSPARVPAHRNGPQSTGRQNSPLPVFSGSGPLFSLFPHL